MKKAITLEPKDTRAYLNLSLSYAELGREEDALQVLQKAADSPNDIEVLYQLGRLYTRLTIRSYAQMAALDPDSYRYHQAMGASFEARRDVPHAIAEYKKPSPNGPGCRACTTRSEALTGKKGNSTKLRRNSIGNCGFHPTIISATWKLGNICITKRQYGRALAYLQKAVEQKPDLGQA